MTHNASNASEHAHAPLPYSHQAADQYDSSAQTLQATLFLKVLHNCYTNQRLLGYTKATLQIVLRWVCTYSCERSYSCEGKSCV